MFLTFLSGNSNYNFNKYYDNIKPFCYARIRTYSALRIRIEELKDAKERILNILHSSISRKQREFRLHLIRGIEVRIKRNTLYLKNYYLVRLRALAKSLY